MFSLKERSGFFADFIKLFKGNNIFMGGNLENAVCGSVNDRFSGFNMFFAVIGNKLGSAVGFVAKNVKARCLFEHFDNFLREAFRIGGESLFGNKSGKFPMSGGGIFSFAYLIKTAESTERFSGFFDAGNSFNVSKTKFYHIGNVEFSAFRTSFESVASFVSEIFCVREFANSERIKYYPKNAFCFHFSAPFSTSSNSLMPFITL